MLCSRSHGADIRAHSTWVKGRIWVWRVQEGTGERHQVGLASWVLGLSGSLACLGPWLVWVLGFILSLQVTEDPSCPCREYRESGLPLLTFVLAGVLPCYPGHRHWKTEVTAKSMPSAFPTSCFSLWKAQVGAGTHQLFPSLEHPL